MLAKFFATLILGSVAGLSGFGIFSLISNISLFAEDTVPLAILGVFCASIFIPASSVLIEMWTPAREWVVRRRSFLWYFFGAMFFDYDDDEADENASGVPVKVRTCTVFMLRSLALVVNLLLIPFIIWVLVKSIIVFGSFLLHLHLNSLLGWNWNEILYGALFFGGILFFGSIGSAGFCFLEKKFRGKQYFSWFILGIYSYIGLSVMMGSIFYFGNFEHSGFSGSWFHHVWMSGLAVGIMASGAAFVFLLTVGIRKAISSLGKNYPVLWRIWEQSCPQRAYRIVN